MNADAKLWAPKARKNCIASSGIRFLYETPAKKLSQDPETNAILGVIAEEWGHKCVCQG
jgi:hypothetical protein